MDAFPLELPSQEEEQKKKVLEEIEEAKESQVKEMAQRNTTQKTRRESEIAKNYLNSVIGQQQALDASASEPAGIDMRLFRDLVCGHTHVSRPTH